MKPRLFHQIGLGGEDSSAVRKFLVDNNLQDQIEFSNVTYEGPQKALIERLGAVEAPILFVGEQTLRGKEAIISWLRSNLVRPAE
jgi:hypothetical protein